MPYYTRYSMKITDDQENILQVKYHKEKQAITDHKEPPDAMTYPHDQRSA